MAKSPDRSVQPFLHPPEFDVETPQVAFMQLLIDEDEDAIFNLFQLIYKISTIKSPRLKLNP
jgi:hypothetical protein